MIIVFLFFCITLVLLIILAISIKKGCLSDKDNIYYAVCVLFLVLTVFTIFMNIVLLILVGNLL